MFERVRDRFSLWMAYRETVTQLRRLDRATLSDAGIDPDAIKAVARAAVEGKC